MRRAFFFIVAVCLATSSFASIPRASMFDAPSTLRTSFPETRIRVFDVVTPFARPVPSPLNRALHQAYAELSTTNASGLSRFLSVDPAGESVRLASPQTWNRYTYALNNPLRFIDPTGEMWFKIDDKWTFLNDQDVMYNATSNGDGTTTVTEVKGVASFAAFNGDNITLYQADGSTRSFAAVSGVLNNGRTDPSTQKQVDGHGPLPRGEYSFNPRAIQQWNSLGVANQIGSTLSPLLRPIRGKPTGGWPGGYPSWGGQRAWLTPAAGTKTYGRNGFSIHGGWFPGSAGCIDLTGHVDAFFGAVDRTQPSIPVYVDYP